MIATRRWLLRMIVALVIASPIVRYLSHDLPLFFIANSDMLAVPAVAESVGRHGVSALTDWYWPPAPYVVTDVAPYGLIWLVLPNVWLAPAVFMAVQLAALYLAIRWLALGVVAAGVPVDREAGDREAGEWGAVASFATIVAFAVALVDPARFVLVSYYRAGSFVLCVLAIGLLVRWVGNGRPDARRWVAGVVMVVTALSVASDPLLLPAAVGPLLVLLVTLAFIPAARGGWQGERRLVFRHVGTLVVAAVVGVGLNGLIVTDESTYGPSLTGGRIRGQAGMILDLFTESSVVLRIVAVIALALALVEIVRRAPTRVTPLVVIVAFWVISAGAHLVAMLLDTSEPALRYVQLVALLPLVWAGPILARRLSSRRWGPASLALGMSAWVVVPALGQVGAIDTSYQAPEAACLDQVVPHDSVGVSGYWEARLIHLHSRYERDVAPLDGAGDPMRINASSEWFDQPYDFAVVGTQTPGWDLPLHLMEALAPTGRVSECGTLLVLDAGDGGLRLDRLSTDGGQVSFDGCDLGSIVGAIVPDVCVIEVPEGASGFASFGGYLSLQPGTYEITLDYSSDAPAEVTLGTVEVTRVRTYGGEVEVVLAAPLFAPVEPGPATLRVSVVVPDDGEGFVAELRTITNGAAAYRVERVTVTHE